MKDEAGKKFQSILDMRKKMFSKTYEKEIMKEVVIQE